MAEDPARICTSTRNRSTLSTPTKWPDRAQLETFEHVAYNSSPDSLMVMRKVITDCGALEAAKNHSRTHADVVNHLILETT